MDVVMRSESWDVRNRLAELGLEEESLQDVVRQGYVAFIDCTANHPPLIPAIWAWGETVRALREYLLPIGWNRSDENNYSLVIDPSGRVAIAVATGDEGTGQADAIPSNKAPKGSNTIGAVNVNQLELDLPVESLPAPARPPDRSDARVTWVLLMHRALDEVRCELSLPSSMGTDGHIDGWCERILLSSIPLDDDMAEVIPPPTTPDISIDVRRRA